MKIITNSDAPILANYHSGFYINSWRKYPLTKSWLKRGANASSDTVNAYKQMENSFMIEFGGMDQVFLWLHFFTGNGFESSLIQIVGNGVVSNFGFVPGDYSPLGLKGNSAFSKHLLVPVTLLSLNHLSGGLMVMLSEMDRINFRGAVGCSGTGAAASIGYGESELGGRFSGNPSVFANSNQSDITSGIFMISSISLTDLRFYRNGVQTAINTNGKTSFTINNPIRVFTTTNSSGIPNTPTNNSRTFGYGILKQGYAPAQIAIINNILNTFRANMGWPIL